MLSIYHVANLYAYPLSFLLASRQNRETWYQEWRKAYQGYQVPGSTAQAAFAPDIASQTRQLKQHYNAFYRWVGSVSSTVKSIAAGQIPEEIKSREERGHIIASVLAGSIGYKSSSMASYQINAELIEYAKKVAATSQAQNFFRNHGDVVTIILTGLLTPDAVPADAMGYSGVDRDSSFYKELNKKYFPVNQKNLLADHCAMMMPTSEFMSKIYKGQLMAGQSQSFKYFGKYPVG